MTTENFEKTGKGGGIDTEELKSDGPTKKAKKQSSILAHFTKIRSEPLPEMPIIGSSPVKMTSTDNRPSLPHTFIDKTKASLPNNNDQLKLGGSIQQDQLDDSRVMNPLVPHLPNACSNQSLKIPPVPLMKFTVEEKELFALELQHLPEDWLRHLAAEMKKPYFKRLKEFLMTEQGRGCKIFPPEPLVYSWARLCPFKNIKVVIIGQDPYHNDGQAMGLCFSVPIGVAVPPSLINIYKELTNDIPGFTPPNHGDLSSWANQGVLLLNTSLTVRAHEPASHAGHGWEAFTDATIRAVATNRRNIVFLLWGNHAQKKANLIDRSRHLVLTGVHPSPLSAARGFFGCGHFSKANAYLEKNGINPVDWIIPRK